MYKYDKQNVNKCVLHPFDNLIIHGLPVHVQKCLDRPKKMPKKK